MPTGLDLDPDELRRFVAPHLEPAAQPKAVTVLNEMPRTPIGKIYRPALRLLATREAVSEATVRSGLQADELTLDITEAGIRLGLANPGRAADVKQALPGMPINYTIQAD